MGLPSLDSRISQGQPLDSIGAQIYGVALGDVYLERPLIECAGNCGSLLYPGGIRGLNPYKHYLAKYLKTWLRHYQCHVSQVIIRPATLSIASYRPSDYY